MLDKRGEARLRQGELLRLTYHYAHLSPTHLWKAVEGLTQVGTVTKTVTEEKAAEEETEKLLIKVVSRLGLEPRALALKEPCSTV